MTFRIASRGGQHPHLPVQLLEGNHTSMDLERILSPGMDAEDSDMWDPGQERLGGYFLPPFQRGPRWTQEQKERFVESALLGVGLGTIVVVDAINCPMQNDDRFAATDRWLLDGRQRCSALRDYGAGLVTVFRGTECEHRWDDLNTVERRRFNRLQIGVMKIQTDDVAYCREIYNRLNYGGTPHEEDERA